MAGARFTSFKALPCNALNCGSATLWLSSTTLAKLNHELGSNVATLAKAWKAGVTTEKFKAFCPSPPNPLSLKIRSEFDPSVKR